MAINLGMKEHSENWQEHFKNIIQKCTFEIENCSLIDQTLPFESRNLRLRGGVAFEDEEPEEQQEIRRSLKSPIQECKSIMDKFDEILAAYKSSLGPCGEATCPYSQSMMQDSCRKKCHSAKVVLDEPPKEECQGKPCEHEECPYADKKKLFVAACGSPNCAYSRYKLGLVDQDASLEYMMLPPAISGKCGSPNCDYPIQPDLPPIHWDCPDPLPKGVCRNPNCPLQPPALKKLKVSVKKRICSCQDCPYAFPPPCGLPSCPFRENPCPFLERKKNSKSCSCSSNSAENDKRDNVCSNPSCPFAAGSSDIQNINDPTFRGEILVCSNPNCPFATKKNKEVNNEVCDNPEYPWKSKIKQVCASDKKEKAENLGLCGNANCPYAVYEQEANGSFENDNEKSKKVELCGNPNCPYAVYAQESSDYKCPVFQTLETTDFREQPSCLNPNCPFEKQKWSKTDDGFCSENKLCDKPNCSHHKRRSLEPDAEKCFKPNGDCEDSQEKCDNPDCPYINNKIKSTYKEELCSYPDNENSRVSNAIAIENNIVITKECEISDARKKSSDQHNCFGESKSRPKKKRGKFVYLGNMYPGVKIGHKECVTQVFNVPPKMGWLWNITPDILRMKPRRGWKPGALTKTIAARIRAHRNAKGLGLLRLPKFGQNDNDEELGGDIKVIPKPTLYIQKKEGAYSIVMNPLKDPKTLAENEDPYMECTPMRFKISPNKPKKTGSLTCFCDEEDEGNISSSESELDIEFTPPAGIIHPERFKKKLNVIHCETQYYTKDFDNNTTKRSELSKTVVAKEKKSGKGKAEGKGKGKENGKEKGKEKGKKGKEKGKK